ncbi:hypothetical protein BJY00DRAFT_297409 [Aspergillus carlsbadensis]|nr:hypothetical protein BJY00DRAFT_297409 [Aspergillus carlsbadensis]
MTSKFAENMSYYDNQPHAWSGQHPQYPPQQQPQYQQYQQQQYPPTHPQAYPAYPPQQYPGQTMDPHFQNNGYPQAQPNYAQSPPPPQKPSFSLPRTLDVSFTSWTGRHLRVCENTEDGPLVYSADLKSRKPHMLFKAEGSAQLPATVIFHSFSRTIDITLNGSEFPMKATSKWKYEFAFESAALGGKRLIWKKSSGWKYLNVECVDESGTVYARFNMHKGLSTKKAGKLEILEPCQRGGQGLVDEVVVTGLADVYLQLMQTMSANSAAGASAGVSAAVSA